MPVPAIRIRACNDAPLCAGGQYVLYWMIAYRRAGYNFALQHAVEKARELGRPLVVLEALRIDYPWASERLHQFVIEGMAGHQRAFDRPGVVCHPYVEPAPGAGRGLLEALARNACLVVTDDFPCFFLPRMVEAAARRLPVRLEAVDSNGLIPLRAPGAAFPTAYAFRRFVQKNLTVHLADFPRPDPFEGEPLPPASPLPAEVEAHWPRVADGDLDDPARFVARLPIDHSVTAGCLRGGERAARHALGDFLDERLEGYEVSRNEPDLDTTSNLSAWLHFGHISSHEVFSELMGREQWRPEHASPRCLGQRQGWWGVGRGGEAFLDQLVTWREVGFQAAAHLPGFEGYDSLPPWALDSLARHQRDKRPALYDVADFEEARTHDRLWNAAQNQLRREGRLHNQMRMLWGKKVLEWTADPRVAFDILVHLNNRYALDGRDPNSYSGIGWCFGRFDRPWPERAVFGVVRAMSSERMPKKHAVGQYLARYG